MRSSGASLESMGRKSKRETKGYTWATKLERIRPLFEINTIEEEGGGARRKLEAETFFTLYIIFLKNRVLSNEIRADDL